MDLDMEEENNYGLMAVYTKDTGWIIWLKEKVD